MFKKWGYFHQTSIFWDIKKTHLLMDTYMYPDPHPPKKINAGRYYILLIPFWGSLQLDGISNRVKLPFKKKNNKP